MITAHHILYFGIYLCVINAVSFITFYKDKRAARRGEYRISEATLLFLALFGGTVGSITAQYKFRHKTRKQPFKFQLYSIAVLQVFILIAMCFPQGRDYIVPIVLESLR